MLTNHEAMALSKLIAERDVFPEAKEEISRTLFDYYKALLARDEFVNIPAVRRIA